MLSVDAARFSSIRDSICGELTRTVGAVSDRELEQAQRAILRAPRVFIAGAGRSGLALKMAAMRLMHLGLTVHVAGEITTPALVAGDLLLIASGSGTTASAVQAAVIARKVGAEVLALTAAPESKLAELASALIMIPAATKQDHGGSVSQQYAGALFEQTILLIMDTLFQSMWQERGESAEDLWKRHANLE